MSKKRMVVIGIDGGTLDMIRPLLQQQELPNITSIISKGLSGKLTSVIPPITAPAWASFMTGVNPGKHGIFDFISDIHLNGKDGRVLDSRDIRTQTIWDYLSGQHKRLIVVGVPFTYPAFSINGVMVSLSAGGDIDVYPKESLKDIISSTGYRKELCRPVDTFGEVAKEDVLNEIIKRNDYLTEKIKDISCHLLRNQEWDFFMAHFMSTDTIQHYFWHFVDSGHPAYDKKLAQKYKNTIYDAYKKVDNAIGEILQLTGDDCNVIVLSDHGFAPIYKFFYVNKWLEEKKLLRIKRKARDLYEWKMAFPSIHKIFKIAGLENLASILPGWVQTLKIPAVKRCPLPLNEWIDWKHTRAYASPFGININLKGREPEGIVEGDDYEEVRRFIKEELLKLNDSALDSRIMGKVLFREEVYEGSYIDNAADLFFVFNKPYYLQSSDVLKNNCFEELSKDNFATANHRYSPDGILMMCGPDIVQGGKLNNVRITDIAPTILYLNRIKIPRTLDGRVITESINPEYINSNPVEFIEVKYEHRTDRTAAADRTEDAAIKEHLKRLGYLG